MIQTCIYTFYIELCIHDHYVLIIDIRCAVYELGLGSDFILLIRFFFFFFNLPEKMFIATSIVLRIQVFIIIRIV